MTCGISSPFSIEISLLVIDMENEDENRLVDTWQAVRLCQRLNSTCTLDDMDTTMPLSRLAKCTV